MPKMKSMKSIEEKISLKEAQLHKLKTRCDHLSNELETLYDEKTKLENQELLDAILNSRRSRAEILAFLESST